LNAPIRRVAADEREGIQALRSEHVGACLLLFACGVMGGCSLSSRPGRLEGFCFVADTLVLTPSGSTRIADLRPGDAILSFDLATSSMVATTIRERFE